MKPELRKRLVDSIEYLRKLGFFQDYSNLSSEEILERIKCRKVGLLDVLDKEEGFVFGKEGYKKFEEGWKKESDAVIDYAVIIYDEKRVFDQDVEVDPAPWNVTKLFEKIVRISRGVFNPTNVVVEKKLGEKWSGRGMWSWYRVWFNFREERHMARFLFLDDYLCINFVMNKINELIKDSGYQYYRVSTPDLMDITIVVLTEEEAERLRKERGWKLWNEWETHGEVFAGHDADELLEVWKKEGDLEYSR